MTNIDDIFADLILDLDIDQITEDKDGTEIKISKESPLEMFNNFIINCRKLCKDKYGAVEYRKEIILNMQQFCKKLNEDNLCHAKEIFLKLPKVIQCMYIQTSDFIITNKNFFKIKSYNTAFNIFNLFKLKEDKNQEVYSYLLKKFLQNDIKDIKKKTSSKKTSSKKTDSSKKKEDKVSKYSKKYQKYKEIEDTDPLYIFYYSCYKENPESRLAITWLSEHGIFSSSKRDELEKKYEKLKEQNLLIK